MIGQTIKLNCFSIDQFLKLKVREKDLRNWLSLVSIAEYDHL